MDNNYSNEEGLIQIINYLNGNKMISLPTTSGCEFYPLRDIIRCEGDNNYTTFHIMGAKKLVISRTLGEYEQVFKEYCFYRVHQSHLINLRHIKSYNKDRGIITLTDGSSVEISRRKKLDFFKLFELH